MSRPANKNGKRLASPQSVNSAVKAIRDIMRRSNCAGALQYAPILGFVNEKLLPHLKGLESRPGATGRHKVISEIMSGVERTRVDTEKNFLDVIDKVHEISSEAVDPTHVFTLSQVYEGLLLKMGEKGNDGGQFFTPREIIRAIDPGRRAEGGRDGS